MKLIIDTSALVSIETVNLVSRLLKYFDVIISDTVRLELIELSQYEDEHGKSSRRILEMVNKGQRGGIAVLNWTLQISRINKIHIIKNKWMNLKSEDPEKYE